MALPGTQSYDFLKEKWSGNLRQIHSLIPLIESMLKDKAVYYMLDFDTFPSPVVPQQAMHLEQQDRIRYDEAVAKHELRVQENANWEQHHGADFRRLRQIRDVERIVLRRHDEDHFQWMLARRPREAKFKLPRTLCETHHKKDISEYPKEVKKEMDDCNTIIKIYEQVLSPTIFNDYRTKLWHNRLCTDSEREKAISPLLHLMDLRSTPNTDVLKEIEADFTNIATIGNFKSALAACAILTNVQEELSHIDIDLMKSDDFLIKCIVKQFDKRDSGLQQFMIKHSLGEGILAPASVQVASYQARAAAIAARAANPIPIVSMTWPNFIENLKSMDKLINCDQDTSIYSARSVAFSTSLHQPRETDHEVRMRETRMSEIREVLREQRDERVNVNRDYRHRDRSQERERSQSQGRTNDRSRSRDRNAGHTPAAQPRAYPHWERPATVPASTVPTHRRKKFEFNHRVNVATREPGQILSEVKMDMYGNPFIVPDAASGFVQYLQPDDE